MSAAVRRLLEGGGKSGQLLVSTISIVELGALVAKGRVDLCHPVSEWVGRASEAAAIRLVALAPEIAVEAARMGDGLLLDPADRVIAATARIEGATVLTADHALHACRHVRCLW